MLDIDIHSGVSFGLWVGLDICVQGVCLLPACLCIACSFAQFGWLSCGGVC